MGYAMQPIRSSTDLLSCIHVVNNVANRATSDGRNCCTSQPAVHGWHIVACWWHSVTSCDTTMGLVADASRRIWWYRSCTLLHAFPLHNNDMYICSAPGHMGHMCELAQLVRMGSVHTHHWQLRLLRCPAEKAYCACTEVAKKGGHDVHAPKWPMRVPRSSCTQVAYEGATCCGTRVAYEGATCCT
jgi:hypothetical protein